MIRQVEVICEVMISLRCNPAHASSPDHIHYDVLWPVPPALPHIRDVSTVTQSQDPKRADVEIAPNIRASLYH